MRTKSIFRLTALAVLVSGAMTGSLLTSCSNDELIPEAIPGENFPEDGRVRISTSVEAPASSVITRAGGDEAASTSAYNGTTLGLFVDYTTPAGTTTTPEDPYTRFNVKWTQTTDASGNGTGSWMQDTTTPDNDNSTATMLWKNSSSTATVWAYAPYQTAGDLGFLSSVIDTKRAIRFDIPTDQREGIDEADLVSAKLTDFNPYNGLNAKNAIDLTLKHQLVKFTVAVTFGTQFDGQTTTDGQSIAVSSMTLHECMPSVALVMADNSLSPLFLSGTPVQMHPTTVTSGVAPDATTTLPAFEAICCPFGWSPDIKLLTLTLNNGKTYSYTISNEVSEAIGAAEKNGTLYGSAFRLNLKVGKDKLEIADGADAITVVGWDDNNGAGHDISGGEAKPLSISYNATSKVLEIASASGLRLLGCMGIATPTTKELSAANLTMEQYKAMKDLAKASNYSAVLTSDIDLSEYDSWLSIGVLATEYKGVFDGQGHSISGLKSDANTDYKTHCGLFGFAIGATFRNLTIVAPTMVTFSQGGALVGKATACTISNCKVTDVNITGSQKTGALIGEMSGECLVEDCYSSGKITGVSQQSSVLGGLIGAATGTVRRCGSTVEISAPSMQQIGGLAGSASACSLVACYAKGNVEGKITVGGLVGSMSDAVNITGCYATGSVTANHYSGALTGGYNGSTANVTGFYYRGASNDIYLVGEVSGSTTVMKIKYCASRSSKGLLGSDFTNSIQTSDTSLFFGNQFNTALTFAEIRAVVASAEAQSVWDEVEPDASYVDGYNLSGGDGKNSFWIENADASLKLWWE